MLQVWTVESETEGTVVWELKEKGTTGACQHNWKHGNKKEKGGKKRKTNLLCRVKCDSFSTSMYRCLPECSSESCSSLISRAHPSSRRMLFVACRSACSNKPLRPSACGTWGVQLSVRSRLRKTVPSQNTRSVHCTRLPSNTHSRSRRTMWFAGKWGDMETSWCSTQKYTLYVKYPIEDFFFFFFYLVFQSGWHQSIQGRVHQLILSW